MVKMKSDSLVDATLSYSQEDYDLHKYFTEDELVKTAKELKHMETHLEEYPSFDNREDLKRALLSDD